MGYVQCDLFRGWSLTSGSLLHLSFYRPTHVQKLAHAYCVTGGVARYYDVALLRSSQVYIYSSLVEINLIQVLYVLACTQKLDVSY